MIEETFFLYPPNWLKTPPNPASTKLFKTYAANAPRGTFPEQTSTHQGLYCLTSSGEYLAGKFARQTNHVARETLTGGLSNFDKIATKRNYQTKPVPTNKLALYGGNPIRKSGLKLQVAYRDLPRGEVRRPGNAQFPNPYNLGWYDFTPSEARSFLSDSKEKVALPDVVFKKLALTRLKDAVRGQMNDWGKDDIKSGQLFTQLISDDGARQVYRLTGNAFLQKETLSFKPTFNGSFTFNTRVSEFTGFRLLATGQRTGKGHANGRSTDEGPAPMAISFTLFRADEMMER